MAKQFEKLEKPHQDFIEQQHLFFVGSAAETGRVNLSPKGGDALRILGPNRIAWRNFTGSGNETAGHLARVNRMTLMWCSFETRPLILRAYGTARTLHPRDDDWAELDGLFPEHISARQVFDMTIDLVQTSCGYQVPFMDYQCDRDTLDKWAENKGRDGVKTYWDERNRTTLDGWPTGILPE